MSLFSWCYTCIREDSILYGTDRRREGMGKRQKTILMTEGNIWKQILWFSIPLILGNLLQQMYNTMDSVIVGNFVGSDALAAVGASSSLLYLLIAFSTGAATGAGVVVAQLYGAGDREKVQDAVHTALGIAVVLGLILTVVGIAVSPQILVWMKTPEDIMDQSVEYLRVYFAGVVFNVIYNMAAGILNAVGNSKRSLMYLGVASFLNIGLDVFFIAVLKMGVAGAAIATDICQLISSILIVGFLMRVPDKYQVTLRKIRIHRHMAARIIQIGLPSGIQNMVISLSNVLVQTGVNGFGTNAVAGFSAYLKVDGFNILPVMSFSMAATTFTGQNYGAGKKDRVKKGMWVTLAMSIIYTVVTGVLLLTFAKPIISIFTSDTEVIAYGVLVTKYFCPFYFFLGIMHSLAGTVRGTGRTIPPMVITLLALCVFRVIWVQFVVPGFETIRGIYVVYPLSWFIGAVMMIVYTWKGRWREEH